MRGSVLVRCALAHFFRRKASAMQCRYAVTAVVALLASSVRADPGEFAQPPKGTRVGDQARVAFALSKATDVEVSVLDANGTVARHLAAGVLGGKHPPPPPLQPGLEQVLNWDGKDDGTEAAAGGPFQV